MGEGVGKRILSLLPLPLMYMCMYLYLYMYMTHTAHIYLCRDRTNMLLVTLKAREFRREASLECQKFDHVYSSRNES